MCYEESKSGLMLLQENREPFFLSIETSNRKRGWG